MAYAGDRLIHDADSHLMELPDVLDPYLDPKYLDAFHRLPRAWKERDIGENGVDARYTYVSPGHHFRGTAIPWESKVSFKHSEVLSYQSEIEFVARFLTCQTIARRSTEAANSIRDCNGRLDSQRTTIFTIVSRVGKYAD